MSEWSTAGAFFLVSEAAFFLVSSIAARSSRKARLVLISVAALRITYSAQLGSRMHYCSKSPQAATGRDENRCFYNQSRAGPFLEPDDCGKGGGRGLGERVAAVCGCTRAAAPCTPDPHLMT
jgi:hypothetical protein